MTKAPQRSFDRRSALAFIVAFGIVSLFADMAYEGMRGISGPFLGSLGASAAIIGIVAGTGELAGNVLRLLTGRLAQLSGAYWPITIAGYAIQMAAVPLLAFAGNWQIAALMIVLERTGKAVRNPAGNTMMSHAGEEIGHGWAFGLHEALDQCGALAGPLVTAFVLVRHGGYREGFLWLGVPAVLTIASVLITAVKYPQAAEIASAPTSEIGRGLSRPFWLYTLAAALVAFGFADYPLIAYHFGKAHIVSPPLVPVFYAVAMAVSGLASVVFGRLFDAKGLSVLFAGFLIGAFAAPCLFLGGLPLALAGTILWGAGLGAQGSVFSAAIAQIVPLHARAGAFGIFTALFGVGWFLGSTTLGALYDISRIWLAAVSAIPQLVALVPLFLAVRAAGRP